MSWKFVKNRFVTAQSNLLLTENQISDGCTKLVGIKRALNRHYWHDPDSSEHMLLAGSWGKGTAIRPPTDIDALFILPKEVFDDFNRRQGNVQSQLLQSVRGVLGNTYSQTTIRGDGQVVVVAFNTITIEIVPAFEVINGGYYICDTNNGGTWKRVFPNSELSEIDNVDARYSGSARKLTRLMKRWKRECNVPIKGFHIEKLVQETLEKSWYSSYHEFWYDWLVRDIFAHMISRAGQGFFMSGPGVEWVNFGDQWQSRAQTAYDRAVKACYYESNDMEVSAGLEWQKIFGTAVPAYVGC